MNETLLMIAAFIGGAVLGVLFFGGLWLTVKKAVTAKVPALWLVGSFVLRTGVTLLGFYFIGGKDWQSLVLCLLGFIVARQLIIRTTKSWDAKHLSLKNENSYGA
ncbi:hypothetical protein LCGC14_0651890 [marine sediment metagenome]|uniref:ATP synthase subunit I n=2 Tax=root TaxID=1 RepID=A0A831VSF5_9FLAO|nr:ATP synthase subunit I [Pricia antarctica]